jgi:site-specific DNA recombinase
LGSEATALAGLSSQANADRLVEFQNHIGEGERRLSDIERQIQEYTGLKISEQAVNQAMTEFDSLWTALTPREQIQVLELLIERVEFDGKANNVSVMFRPLGWQALSQQVVQSGESAA